MRLLRRTPGTLKAGAERVLRPACSACLSVQVLRLYGSVAGLPKGHFAGDYSRLSLARFGYPLERVARVRWIGVCRLPEALPGQLGSECVAHARHINGIERFRSFADQCLHLHPKMAER